MHTLTKKAALSNQTKQTSKEVSPEIKKGTFYNFKS